MLKIHVKIHLTLMNVSNLSTIQLKGSDEYIAFLAYCLSFTILSMDS